jgi:HD superfamily phosphohydrolase
MSTGTVKPLGQGDGDNDERHHALNRLVAGFSLADGRYELTHKDGNVEPRDQPAVAVASGGAGQVFRATNELGLDYAIKILNPSKALIKDGSGVFHDTFDREIKLLARITHTRLAKIIDADWLPDDDGENVPFYVMDFVPGTPFQEYIEGTELSGRDFLKLIDQVLEGVEYLHARWIMHCDLKSANILVGHDVELGQRAAQATVVDLGVAKFVKDPTEPAESEEDAEDSGSEQEGGPLADFQADVPDEEKTYFVSSESITREEWRPYLNKAIPRKALRRQLFPSHDLYGIGVLITNAVSVEQLKDRLREEIDETGLEALEELAERLTETTDSAPYYRSVAQLRRDWQKLDPRHLAPVGIPELAIGAQAKTSIATPSGRVSLTSRALDLINHPAFQRMRLVPQLELVSLVYPGATHTRLLHSLSTFDMARRCILHLLRDPSFRLMVDQEQIEAALLGALCHDIGHYPLSHMFEDFAEEERLAGGERTTPTDDNLFYAFIDPGHLEGTEWAPFAEAATARFQKHPGGGGTLHSHLFESGKFTPAVLKALHDLDACGSPSAQILRGLISSPVDADKLSYLTDDSAMTGVRYGLGIDVDAFLSSLRAPSRADLKAHAGSKKALVAITDKGLPAAEGVILSRYWMLKRVYWHHTNRAAIAMTKYVIAELRRQGRLDMVEYVDDTMFGTVHDALALLSSRFASHASDHVNPLVGLADGNRWLYKRIMTFAKEDPDEGNKDRYEAMARIKSDKVAEITDLARQVFAEHAGREVRPGEVLLDVPIKQREFIRSPLLVYPHREPDVGRPIKKASPLIDSHALEFDIHVKKCRVFVHPHLFDAIGDRLDDARRAFEEALADRYKPA